VRGPGPNGDPCPVLFSFLMADGQALVRSKHPCMIVAGLRSDRLDCITCKYLLSCCLSIGVRAQPLFAAWDLLLFF